MRRSVRDALFLVCLLVGVLMLPQDAAHAATLPASDAVTLINAINTANAAPDLDIIVLTADIALAAAVDFTNGTNGLPSITTPIQIEGGGYTISGNGTFRIFHVAAAGTLTLNTITVRNGSANAGGALGNNGGAILNNGTLNIAGSTITGSTATTSGGAIYSGDTLNITNTTVSNNTAGANGTAGGGIFINLGTNAAVSGVTFTGNTAPNGQGGGVLTGGIGVTVSDSTFANNQAEEGGGLWAAGGPAAEIERSTFSANTATGAGGGAAGNVNVTNSTFSGNIAGTNGGGINGGNAVLNSTFVGNTAAAGGGIFTAGTVDSSIVVNNAGGDCAGGAAGANNRDLDGSCPGSVVLTGLLGTLFDNGGTTQTHYPGPSADPGTAIDAIPQADCPPPATDQIGTVRDWDGNSDGVIQCDIGAVELTTPLPFIDFNFDITDLVEDPPGTATVNITLQFPAPGPIQVFFRITGTACPYLDYTIAGLDQVYSLIIPEGATTASFSITSINDGLEEPVENIALEMSFIGPARRVTSGAGGTRTLAVIRENPRQPTPQPQPPAPTTPPVSGGFMPSLLKTGFARGGQVEWVVSVGNTGTGAGTSLVLTDVVPGDYRIDRVETPLGTATVNGQTVTVNLPALAPGQTVQISIFTTPLRVSDVQNTVCLRAANLSGERCVSGAVVRQLPQTGESPAWRSFALTAIAGTALGLLWILTQR
ncbi:MAG: choice-of-anchor Q domain-containing protein [bacterium]|nr:choice-of-anchor Q domain-containing protein [bacterium]